MKISDPHPAARRRRVVIAAVAFATVASLWGCPPAPPALPPKAVADAMTIVNANVRWKTYAARRQATYIKLDLPVITAGTRVTVGAPLVDSAGDPAAAAEAGGSLLAAAAQAATEPVGGDHWVPASPAWSGAIGVYSSRIVRGSVEGPLVDQLTGQPRMATDAGSYLIPLSPGGGNKDAASEQTYDVTTPMPLYFRVAVPPTAVPASYRFPVRITAPGKPDEEAWLAVDVSDISLPTDPRVMAVATTSVERLSEIYPDTFGAISASYLDRAAPEHKAAIDQLDVLVRAARAQGVALFVEDLLPVTKVDALGQVALDWDAYDRVMQPYMDGTAFEDRIPFAVWLAPVPPRRIRDASTQLWQYIDACAKHFAAKGWTATPAFLHPAMANSDAQNKAESVAPDGRTTDPVKLRADVGAMMRLHMPREMLAVTTPDPGGPPHGQLWTLNDDDPRLPPGGAMGNEYSVRAWPWLCLARGNVAGGSPTGVKGFVWRDALARSEDLKPDAGLAPLLVVDKNQIHPSFRMMYLNAGLQDAALIGLLQKRTDATQGPATEILAGMVGRTAMDAPASLPGLPMAESGFLYAGWSADRSAWGQASPTLQRLIVENDPGTRATVKADDPLYLAAKVWLAQSRRPVARIAGYTFSMRPGRAGNSDILDATVHVLAENPIDSAARIDAHFASLPGDFEMPPAPVLPGEEPQPRRRSMSLPPAGAGLISMPVAGHVELLEAAPGTDVLELTERFDGAMLRLPVQLPIYRIHATENPPKTDGEASDWPADAQLRVYGEMKVATRYLTRPDLISSQARPDDSPATVRVTYDANFLYVLARCPQDAVSDERNTEWPTQQTGGGARWWATDGLQIELAAMPPTEDRAAAPRGATSPYDRVLKIAFKPTGVLLMQTGKISRDAGGTATLAWQEGPPLTAGSPAIKYGITTQRQNGHIAGYTVEAAIPRAWIDAPGAGSAAGTKAPAWRFNVLRHRASDLASSSWAGPVVHDDDVAMMGALLGE